MWLLALLLSAPIAQFPLENGAAGNKHLIETMTGGVAVLDFDRDGRPDYFAVNGAPIPSLLKTGPKYWNRLYRNTGNGFEDATAAAGLAGSGYDMGAAAADYDNDGHTDLFVTGVRRNTLYRNLGNGKFQDVTMRAGFPGTSPWAVGAGFFDMENDGDLDLFVVNYVRWDPAAEKACGEVVRTYCHPREYAPQPNALYRNNGDGTFTDITGASGIGENSGKGMGLAFGDIDGDGLLDVFLTNDTEPNFLFRNLGGGKFEEVAGPAGVAFNDDGRALSSMGADFRDWDNDGREDLFLTALTNETFPLFRNLDGKRFTDRTYPSLVGRATLPLSGWSAGIFDFDNDGWKDLFAACADVQDNTSAYSGRASRQRNLILRNQRNGTFAAEPFGVAAMHRGAAFADFNSDGRMDAVVTRLGEPPLVWMNSYANGNHWLVVQLRGRKANWDAIGAVIRIETEDGKVQWNRVTTAVGYASASQTAVHFGLGNNKAVRRLEVTWPGGTRSTHAVPQLDRLIQIEEGARP
jgi:enediyne biosynthesis protein E4